MSLQSEGEPCALRPSAIRNLDPMPHALSLCAVRWALCELSGCGFGQELSGLFGVGWNGFGLAP